MKTTVTFLILFSIRLFAIPYPQLTADIGWSPANFSTVADIKAAFENGRTGENIQLNPDISTTLTMPSQVDWDAKSNSEKALYLINAERVARGLVPLAGVHSIIVTIAQTYATFLLTNNLWGHNQNGSPSDRLNGDGAINGCSETGWTDGPENLSVFVQSGPPILLPVERSVYGWIYEDAGSGWGHRNTCFALFNDNHPGGVPNGSEGFIGIGIAVGGPYQGPFANSWPHAAIVVYNFVDPCSTSTLPVELTAFTANRSGSNVELNWQTATEVNNYGFEIERSLTQTLSEGEGFTNWEKIGFVEGHGNSNSPKDYRFIDKSVTTGKFIYRLKQIDTDGKYEYSDAVEVDLGLPKSYALGQNYPNPFNPTTRINYQLPFDSKVTIELYAITGEKVATLINGELSAGYYNADINTGALNLSSGAYLYRISAISQVADAQAFVQVKKLMIMK